MVLPTTGQLALSNINTELGRSSTTQISLRDAETGVYAPINQSSASRPDGIAPHAVSEWRGYDHLAAAILIFGTFSVVNSVSRNLVAKLSNTGAVDSAFNPNVTGGFTTIFDAAAQSDGKIIIVGTFGAVGGVTRNNIARLNANGTLDTGFTTSTDSQINSVAIDSSGKIYIGGFFSTVNGTSRNGFARLNSDGTLDTAFAPTDSGTVSTIIPFSDGKVFANRTGTTRRYNSNGTIDTSFTSQSVLGGIQTAKLQSDGKIVVGGPFTSPDAGVIRLNSNGTLDTGFTSPISSNFNIDIWDLHISGNGQILVVGDFRTQPQGFDQLEWFDIVRLNSNGQVDTNFLVSPFIPHSTDSVAHSVAVGSDGIIYIGGNYNNISNNFKNGPGITTFNNSGTINNLNFAVHNFAQTSYKILIV